MSTVNELNSRFTQPTEGLGLTIAEDNPALTGTYLTMYEEEDASSKAINAGEINVINEYKLEDAKNRVSRIQDRMEIFLYNLFPYETMSAFGQIESIVDDPSVNSALSTSLFTTYTGLQKLKYFTPAELALTLGQNFYTLSFFRGITAKNVKITKTVDTKVPQSEFSIDKCDGTGPSGFVLNLNKLQMAYADYSWYGAGKIRFGFKDQNGHVVYVHEFKHNNRLNESYFRSGNLPGRYEIENGANATTAPTLFHFGTSIIMDGTFDDDKAYLLTANSRPFAFTNGASFTFASTGGSTFDVVTLNGKRVFVYAIPVAESDAQSVKVGTLVRDPSNTALPEGTYITQVKVDGASSKIFTSHPATSTIPSGAGFPTIATGANLTLGETTSIELTQPLPLISIRLAPSVDSSLTGKLGEREIINRMQMALRQAGVTSNEDVEIFLILNALPSRLSFDDADKPSLSEIIEHVAGDTLQNGTTIYSLKASAGSVEIDLGEILELGNSILGGDGIFPAGPDLLTLAVQPQSTTGIGAATPFFVTGKITWTESQA